MGLTILPEYAALESKDKINRIRGAYTIGGEKYRSVTTILNATVPKPALMYWAVKVTIAALEDGKSLEEARGENRRISSESAALGTAVHKAIQDHFEGRKPKLTPEIEPAFAAALDFIDTYGLTVVECERPVWHPRQKYAGRVDMICEDKDGKIVCIDWKLAKAVYPEHHFQVAAYAVCISDVDGAQRE